MGIKAPEALAISVDDMPNYLHSNHAIYAEVDDASYYITDANDIYWRAQDTTKLNDKGHYTDCSELVPTVSEFMDLPFHQGKSISEFFESATFYASEKK